MLFRSGWTTNTAGAGPTGEYTEWQVSGRSIAGMMQKPPMIPAEVPPFWSVYFTVTDTDATVEQVQALGGQLMTGPTTPIALQGLAQVIGLALGAPEFQRR